MSLDGIFLHALKNEIETKALESRVEKVHQPTREEVILHLRSKNGGLKLLLTAKADAPRIHFTKHLPENPAVPPMFCVLLRKYLNGARLVGVKQAGLERILTLEFESTNELGDKIYPKLLIEIMARHSNIILVDENEKIVDAIKRVDFTKSSVREILPGLPYILPPAQEKLDLLECSLSEAAEKMIAIDKRVSKAAQTVIQGVSPVICREIAYLTAGDDKLACELSKEQIEAVLSLMKQYACVPSPNMLYDVDDKPFDYTFCPITQYNGCGRQQQLDSFSELLDAYYYQRERSHRIKQRSQDLFKQLKILHERAVRKGVMQTEQLRDCAQKDKLKTYGDLIGGYLYCLEKGAAFYDVDNFYEEGMPKIRIPADPSLTPSQNAQKYYKEYRKLQTAETMLADLIAQSKQEADYLESVIEELSRSETEHEISEIKEELYEGGYLKRNRGNVKNKKPKPSPPLRFHSKDGFEILVGRNNVQNDRLTLRDSRNYDLWLHVKEIPGSHVIINIGNKEASQQAIYDGAMLAAFYSKGRESSHVAVDYTIVKNVKKPQGAKPGRVIYDTYNTIYVTPDESYIKQLESGRED